MNDNKIKVILAKPGLDGHDKGIRLIALSMLDFGFDVKYLGLRQSPEDIVKKAMEFNADFIGLSILSGVHIAVSKKVLKELKNNNANIPLLVGGIIPPQDITTLNEIGVAKVFPVGTKFTEMNQWIAKQYELKNK